eukprot:CAMPEP_0202904554 /NCGR_PEP_ID=MMETSP1392-20130828/29972_1 /ASSEMBLY_ACC=CAM_ASM_000868 /TAXON_ID=225041 /ORGANISM="Chlamydomonas chlamydogama, Strain SAG 11-48b" /LENGTH=535 /DNA_ID=CAMNT_0049592221 /DNA_START=68 /DNA_END=1672 /DNA_ORIENTATION=+
MEAAAAVLQRPPSRALLERDSSESGVTSSTRMYGGGFKCCFQKFLESREFTDVVVTLGDDPKEYHLHSLLLANRSDFFHKALTSDFSERRERRIRIDAAYASCAWEQLVEYFYTDTLLITDDNVLPLMALSRQLLIPTVDSYCIDYVKARLKPENCLKYLRDAVQYNLHDLQYESTTLAARGLYHLTTNADLAGLPPQTIVDILQHEELTVQCEQQVVELVLRYLATTCVEEQALREICSQIRFTYLDNDNLVELASQGVLPRDLVLEGALARLSLMDKAHVDVSALKPLPRSSYCCNLQYNLPGGSTHMDVDLESIWEQLSKVVGVKVSGCAEGAPSHVVSSDADAWFETNDSADPPPWIEISMPPNVTLVQLTRYTYCHGHRRAGYFRLRNFKTQVAEQPGGQLVDVMTRMVEQCEVQITGGPLPLGAHGASPLSPTSSLPLPGAHPSSSLGGLPLCAAGGGGSFSSASSSATSGLYRGSACGGTRGFQVLRIQATGPQEDGVHRLCMRNIRLCGTARIDLMRQGAGHFVLRP